MTVLNFSPETVDLAVTIIEQIAVIKKQDDEKAAESETEKLVLLLSSVTPRMLRDALHYAVNELWELTFNCATRNGLEHQRYLDMICEIGPSLKNTVELIRVWRQLDEAGMRIAPGELVGNRELLYEMMTGVIGALHAMIISLAGEDQVAEHMVAMRRASFGIDEADDFALTRLLADAADGAGGGADGASGDDTLGGGDGAPA